MVSTSHIVIIHGSTFHMLQVRASGDWPFWPNLRPNFVVFQRNEFWYALNFVEPSLNWLK